jgi:hypothetical protein
MEIAREVGRAGLDLERLLAERVGMGEECFEVAVGC